jgi:hypothetical protein
VLTKKTIILFIIFCCFGVYAQKNNKNKNLVVLDTVSGIQKKINPLAPTRAAFYSAIFPGLGQAYNKKYWKIPLVYGALGTGLYFYITNDREYNKFRDEYRSRLAGNAAQDYPQYSTETLIVGQRAFRRNRDLSVCIGIYVLNVVDANVDAHLMQFNVNNNLSIKPDLYTNPLDFKQNVGLTMHYNF